MNANADAQAFVSGEQVHTQSQSRQQELLDEIENLRGQIKSKQ
jgi:hypothetical protein